MRKVAQTKIADDGVLCVILHHTERGVYLYLSRDLDDRGSFADEWYESIIDAEGVCRERFGIDDSDWRDVGDTKPGCQDDWIAPMRVKGRSEGKPQWGVLDKMVDGTWELMDFRPR